MAVLKQTTKPELLAKINKRIERMERDAIALGKELAQIDEFYYTVEHILKDIRTVDRDVIRVINGGKPV